ncbi:MAG: LacI family DNA-binding transcriptional regulator [bacterium]|nr:LacI family DNA-binding transcriptional regulator [bacterium]
MKASIKQISEMTGYSPATISNALNRKKGVNSETAQEVFRVAKEIGYIQENDIKKIVFVMYKSTGLIIEDTPFFSLMIDGFQNECRNSGYDMVISYLDKRKDDYETLLKSIINDPDSAIVLLGSELMGNDFDDFRDAKGLLMTLDYWSDDMSRNGVLINNEDSARKAVDYLIEHGHKDIGYLKGSFRIKAFRSRAVGYRISMNKHNLPIDKEYTVTLSTTMDGAYKDMLAYLEKKPKLPSAYFADNDMIAFGAMKALQESGYKIPEDVSIIGFDDLPYCEIVSPRLTSLRVPKQEMGRMAVRRMLEMIKYGDDVRAKTQVCTEFIERDSVRTIQ